MEIDSTLEIRKLPLSHITHLSSILEFADDWKKLMAIVPNLLSKDNYECSVSCDNPAKYNSNHVRLIEGASQKYKKSGTEILLDEWGCSGRIRPSVGHLYHLLKQANLYRAADYVAEKILHIKRPVRPSQGPAAFVPTKLDSHVLEEMLEQMKDPDSFLIENVSLTSLNGNLDHIESLSQNISKGIIPPGYNSSREDNELCSIEPGITSGSLDEFDNETSDELNNINGIPRNDSNEQNSGSLSLISKLDGSEPNIPHLSDLINEETQSEMFIPQVSLLKQDSESIDSTNHASTNQISEDNLPILTGLQTNSVSESSIEVPHLHDLNEPAAYIPNIGDLMSESKMAISSSVIIPDINITEYREDSQENVQDQSPSLPNFSVLISDTQRRTSLNASSDTMDSTKTRPCASPLPNLTLNTHLPHFNYFELETSTNNFNDEPYVAFDGPGRLLGSGAFGKVYLAFGLFTRPVAVKKILLENVEVVNIDDRVTKQFRNEVEVLSRFKHENLLSLLGYSCDGCTYCLLYEYISGGTLKDRLMDTFQKLMWEERLHVALGTAKAISYLHTAFPSPLIHRDIKTANILLDSFNVPKLGDFGIIKLMNNQNTNTGTVIGTTAYMAQEALRGDISVKCDTFSFGVVLLELLTSLPSFDENRDGNDLVTHIQEQCEDSIQSLLDTNVGTWLKNDVHFSDELYTLATNCLLEKKKRPVMVEVTKTLEEIIAKL